MSRSAGVAAGRSSGWRRLASITAAGLVLAAAIGFNQYTIHRRENVADSHHFGYCGWSIAHGARPYRDVWDNKPPGIWWVNALAFLLCGEGERSDLLVGSTGLLLTVVSFVLIATTLYGGRLMWPAVLAAAVLLTDVRFECGANRTETLIMACESAAMLGYLRWRRTGGFWWLLAAAVLAGAAPLFKQAGIAAAIACGVHLLVTQVRGKAPRLMQPWLVFGGGLLLAPAFAAVALAMDGALGEAWFAVATFNRAYFDVGDATWLRMDRAVQPYLSVFPWLYGVAALAAVGGVLHVFGRRRLARDEHAEEAGSAEGLIAVIWLWAAISFYLACVGPGRQAYHLAPVLPALGLLSLYPVRWLAGERGLVASIVARPSIAASLALLALILCHTAAASYTYGAAQRGTGRRGSTESQLAPYEVQAAEIRARTPTSAQIYVWGWSPGTYRFAYRRGVSRFLTLEKLSHVGARARFILDGAMADVRRDPPAILVISTGDLAGLMQPPRGEFAAWINQHYVDTGEIEGMHLLEWRGP